MLKFQLQHQSFDKYSGLISFRTDWFDLLAVQGTLKSLLQHHNSKASVLWHSAFFTVQLSDLNITIGKIIALTIWTFISKVMSLLFNRLSRWLAFHLRSKWLLISWLQTMSTVILDPKKTKSVIICTFSPYMCHGDGIGCHDLRFLNTEFSASFFTLLFHLHQDPL